MEKYNNHRVYLDKEKKNFFIMSFRAIENCVGISYLIIRKTNEIITILQAKSHNDRVKELSFRAIENCVGIPYLIIKRTNEIITDLLPQILIMTEEKNTSVVIARKQSDCGNLKRRVAKL